MTTVVTRTAERQIYLSAPDLARWMGAKISDNPAHDSGQRDGADVAAVLGQRPIVAHHIELTLRHA